MKDIVFVNPPLTLEERYGKLSGAGNTLAPLGLLYLAAMARCKGFEAAIVDASDKLDFESAVQVILQYKPRYVAITATTVSIYNAARLARMVKEKGGNITTIIGGPHLTAVPEETMRRFSEFDIGVLGEGEEALVDLLDAMENRRRFHNVAGIVFRDEGKITRTRNRELITDLDELPFPAWDILPDFPKGYHPAASKFQRLPAAYILSARGCPYKCIFCDRSVFGNRCRFFSAGYVVEMIRFLYNRFGVREISFEDDTLFLSIPRLVAICEQLLKEKLSISWTCNGRVDSVAPDILKIMKRAGCWQIGYGIESGVQEVLDFAKKNVTLQQIENAVELTSKSGILSKGFFILGFPNDTPKTIRHTIDFAKRIKLDDITVAFMTPFPGSKLYADARRYGTFDEDWRKMNILDIVFIPDGLTKEELRRSSKRAIREFYLRPRIISCYLGRMARNPRIAMGIMRGVSSVIRAAF